VPHSGKPISRRLLTFSAEKKNKVDEGESESSVGYNVTEYEDLESSQEAPEVYEFRKLDRRATKKIPSWAIGCLFFRNISCSKISNYENVFKI